MPLLPRVLVGLTPRQDVTMCSAPACSSITVSDPLSVLFTGAGMLYLTPADSLTKTPLLINISSIRVDPFIGCQLMKPLTASRAALAAAGISVSRWQNHLESPLQRANGRLAGWQDLVSIPFSIAGSQTWGLHPQDPSPRTFGARDEAAENTFEHPSRETIGSS